MTIHKSPIMMSMLALFLILVGATVYRIITAIESHPGLVVQDAYISGQSYGDTLISKEQLDKQGYTLTLNTPKDATHGVEQLYTATSKQNKSNIVGAKTIIYFYRPLEKEHDFSLSMHDLGNGTYEAKVKLPLKGRWDVVVEAVKGDYLQRASSKMFVQ